MESNFFYNNENVITRSNCSKLVFTTHRIISQDKKGKFISSVDIRNISSIDTSIKQNRYAQLAVLLSAILLIGAYALGQHVLILMALGLVAAGSVAALILVRKEYIVIHTDAGQTFKVASNNLKTETKTLIGNIEAARFNRLNQQHKDQATPKDTKVVKITA